MSMVSKIFFAKEPQMYISKTDAEAVMDMKHMQSVQRNSMAELPW